MDKKNLIITLYQLSLMIIPSEPKKLISEFGKAVMRQFHFSFFEANVPMMKIHIKLPERWGSCGYTLDYNGKFVNLKFGRGEKIPEFYGQVLRPLFERLDYTHLNIHS